jgi:excisionase family DNA binding protein
MVTETKRIAYRPAEAARALGTSTDTIGRLIANGSLRSVKIGASRFIPASELEAFIARKLDTGANA